MMGFYYVLFWKSLVSVYKSDDDSWKKKPFDSNVILGLGKGKSTPFFGVQKCPWVELIFGFLYAVKGLILAVFGYQISVIIGIVRTRVIKGEARNKKSYRTIYKRKLDSQLFGNHAR